MNDTELRFECLKLAAQTWHRETAGEAEFVVDAARKFYAFATGEPPAQIAKAA